MVEDTVEATKFEHDDGEEMSSLKILRQGFKVLWTGKTDHVQAKDESDDDNSESDDKDPEPFVRMRSVEKYSKLGLGLPGRIWHLEQEDYDEEDERADKARPRVRARIKDREDFQEILIKPGIFSDHRSSRVLSVIKLMCEQRSDKVSEQLAKYTLS